MALIKRILSLWSHGFIFFDDLHRNKYQFKIKRVFYHIAILALIPFFVTCNKNKNEYPLEGPNLSMNDIAGNWKATSANYHYDTLFFDVIAEGGSVSLVIQGDGRFTFTLKLPDEPDNVSSGQLGFDEEWLAISFDDDPDEYEYFFIQLSNGVLTIRGPAEFDFEGDGTEEPANVDLILIRS